MRFYSDVCRQLFDTEKALIEAENKVKKANEEKEAAEKAKKAARATRAKEVENALKEANVAQQKAIKLLKEFTKDYGYFHTSYQVTDEETPSLNFLDLVHDFLNF